LLEGGAEEERETTAHLKNPIAGGCERFFCWRVTQFFNVIEKKLFNLARIIFRDISSLKISCYELKLVKVIGKPLFSIKVDSSIVGIEGLAVRQKLKENNFVWRDT